MVRSLDRGIRGSKIICRLFNRRGSFRSFDQWFDGIRRRRCSEDVERYVFIFLDCLDKDRPIDGPLSPAISRVGQEIVDAAALSARLGKAVQLDAPA